MLQLSSSVLRLGFGQVGNTQPRGRSRLQIK